MNIAHEHDEEGNCIMPPAPAWRFSLWDIAGVTIFGISGIFNALAQTAGLLSQEFCAAANYSRNAYDARQAQSAFEANRAAMAEALNSMVLGPNDD